MRGVTRNHRWKEIFSNHLESSDSEIKRKLNTLFTRRDVANLLEISIDALNHCLFRYKARSRYETFEIPKRQGGTRRIDKPETNMRILQGKLKYAIGLLYQPRHCVHGFSIKRSILTNALPHSRRRLILNVDLLDFFHSVHTGRIIGALQCPPFKFGKQAAITIAQIATRSDGILPQGSPLSPILTNIIAFGLDEKLVELCRTLGCVYSRYADDISISTNKPEFPHQLAAVDGDRVVLGPRLIDAITGSSFQVNDSKTKLRDYLTRQEVTGLTVNEFPNIPRKFIREINSIIWAWRKHGYENAEARFNEIRDKAGKKSVLLKNHVIGKMNYVKMIRGRDNFLVRRLSKRINNLIGASELEVRPLKDLSPSRLRGFRSPVFAWENWFRVASQSIFLMETRNKKGDVVPGTVFYIGKNRFGTAGHNVGLGDINVWLGDSRVDAVKVLIQNEHGKSDIGVLRIADIHDVLAPPLRSQSRLPEIGEQVAAVGFPNQPWRDSSLSMSVGVVESLPVGTVGDLRYIQVSFLGGYGLSGGPLLDRSGNVIGIMAENTFSKTTIDGGQAHSKDMKSCNDLDPRPVRAFSYACPYEYLDDALWDSVF